MDQQTTGFDPAAIGLPEGTTQEEAGAWKDEAPAPEAPAEDAPKPAPEAPAAEPAPVAAEPPKPEAPPEGYVSKAALEEERIRRKEAAQRLKELEAELQRIRQPPPEPPKPVDPITDPDGHQRFLAWQAQQVQALQAQIAEQAHFDRVRTTVAQSEAAFVAEKPDYYDAAKHLMTVRERELAAWRLPAEQIAETIRREAREIADNAVRSGLNPAEIVYAMAEARGYAPKRAEAPEPAPAPVAAPPAAEAMKAHAAAQAATQGLPAGGGAPKPLTVSAAADLSESELMRLPQKELDRLLRGG